MWIRSLIRSTCRSGLHVDQVYMWLSWVRTRWTLLLLFWLGWLGMLLGAVLIILQAPRCRDLPVTSWWNHGPLYQIGSVQAFTDGQDLKGLEQKVDALSQLKVKGVLLGPLHVAPPDEAVSLRFEEISPEVGNLEQFRGFVQTAHRKGISVVLDLTPNYQGTSGPWFSNVSVTNVAERLKSALVFWLDEGVDGVQLSGVERVSTIVPSLWADIRAIVQNGTEQRPDERVLIGTTDRSSVEDVSSLLSSTGVDLLISRVLRPGDPDATERAQSVQRLYSSHSLTRLAWSVGGRTQGHLASLVGPALVKLHQLLLLTLPGTPVFNYGDEVGLMDEDTKFPKMLWDSDDALNETRQEDRDERLSCLSFFRSVSELRGKERSLLFGDFLLLANSSSSMAYLRVWDQSARYLAAFNWAEEATLLQLSDETLPQQAEVVLSTDSSLLPAGGSVELSSLQLGPGQAALLRGTGIRARFRLGPNPSSTIHHPSSIIHHPPPIIHHPPSIIHHPSSIIHHPSSTVHHPPSIIHHPSSTIHHPPSTIHPSSTIHHPPSIIQVLMEQFK
ncbi:unnamed protein product [Pleuronectes platessa]|uniref:Glycosyl hydrolase family 13 catalytic domain-containing protein n=1 Tax=Pleuronectes platessa TaxID=8262 RepID=A0A9N7TNN6_PLEPL|nr:unnamed protein product [Pleuronectes platessa]